MSPPTTDTAFPSATAEHAALNGNRRRIIAQKPEGRGRGRPSARSPAQIGEEFRSIGEAQKIRRAHMKGATHIQACIGSKQHPARIEQIQIRPGNLRAQQPVDRGRLPPCHPPQDIGNRVRTREGRALPCPHIELAKAMKQIAAGCATSAPMR